MIAFSTYDTAIRTKCPSAGSFRLSQGYVGQERLLYWDWSTAGAVSPLILVISVLHQAIMRAGT